jgi:hypothetical protein
VKGSTKWKINKNQVQIPFPTLYTKNDYFHTPSNVIPHHIHFYSSIAPLAFWYFTYYSSLAVRFIHFFFKFFILFYYFFLTNNFSRHPHTLDEHTQQKIQIRVVTSFFVEKSYAHIKLWSTHNHQKIKNYELRMNLSRVRLRCKV